MKRLLWLTEIRRRPKYFCVESNNGSDKRLRIRELDLRQQKRKVKCHAKDH
jgi:DNA phosphorothioation-dependent restriction protein DptG